jgi:outer membrane protein assembly factor BamB
MRRQTVSERTGQRGSVKTLRTGVFLMAALINGVTCGAPGDLLFTLTAPDPQQNAFFGDMVRAVDGDIVISETSRRFAGTDATGRAYLFDGTTGQIKWTFNNPEQVRLDDFAQAVAGGDGRVFVSTIGLEERVYAFGAATGQLLYRIDNPIADGDNFGLGLTYGAGSVLVSAPTYSLPGMIAVGQAYQFNASTGQLDRSLSNPEPKAGDVFGGGFAMGAIGSTLIVGAYGDDLPQDTRPDGDNPGRVWILDRASGQVVRTLENPNGNNQVAPFFFGDEFGQTVAVGGNLIVVGASDDSTAGIEQSGTVYVFDAQSGLLKHTLFSPQPEARGQFGGAVAVTPEGDVLVGAFGKNMNVLNDAGGAYLFDGETGSLLLDIAHPQPESLDGFGWSVSAINGRLLVGAPNANPLGPGTGAVYVFEGIPEPGSAHTGVAGAIIAMVLYQIRKKRLREA